MVSDVTAAWNIAVQENDGAFVVAASESFESMKLTWSLENQGGGTCEIGLNSSMLASGDWAQPKRLIITGEKGWAGSLTHMDGGGRPSDVGPTLKAGWKAAGVGLYSRLDYRIVRHTFVVHDNLNVIVAALLSEVQANQFNGNMGLSMGTVHGTFPSRLRSYCFGINVGDAIRELQTLVGFDWEIDTTGALNIWADSRGTDLSATRTLRPSDCTEFYPSFDTQEMLTTVSALADPSDPYGPKHTLARTMLADDYGRKELAIETDVIADSDKNPDWEDELYRAAHALLKTDGGGQFTLRTVWPSSKAPWTLSNVWLNDIVSVDLTGTTAANVIPSPIKVRLTDVTVSLEPMPPRHGANVNPIYWTECNWQGIVQNLDITDGDPDAVVVPVAPHFAVLHESALTSAASAAHDAATVDPTMPDTHSPMYDPSGR